MAVRKAKPGRKKKEKGNPKTITIRVNIKVDKSDHLLTKFKSLNLLDEIPNFRNSKLSSFLTYLYENKELFHQIVIDTKKLYEEGSSWDEIAKELYPVLKELSIKSGKKVVTKLIILGIPHAQLFIVIYGLGKILNQDMERES